MQSTRGQIDVAASDARRGLLALTVAFSAGVHAALVPEHLREMPPLGYLFTAAATVGAALALALLVRPEDARIPRLAVPFLLTQILGWGLFIALPIPGFAGTPEPVEPIALICKAAELLGVAVALPIALRAAPRTQAEPAPPGPGLATSESASWEPRHTPHHCRP